MTALVKIHRKGQMTLPSRLRSAIGLAEGDLVEASCECGKIILTPKLVLDRAKFSSADDELQRRKIIDAELAKADEDVERGRVYGPFDTHEEFIASLQEEASKLRAKRPKRPTR